MANLIHNAIKFSKANQAIEVAIFVDVCELKSEKIDIRVKVSD